MRRFFFIPFLLLTVLFTACSETSNDTDEYAHWKQRNTTFFSTMMKQAQDSIARAKAQYGDEWEAHCNWRTYQSYSLSTGVSHTLTDSICLQILRRGEEGESPIGTDSVRINYRTLLMPTDEHPQGIVADHSGLMSSFASVFDRTTARPSTFKVNSLCRGVATALLYMKPGDLWRVYMPSTLAYGKSGSGSIPGHSTMVFEMDLVDIWPMGSVPTPWH